MKVAKSLSQSYTIIIWHLELLDKLPSSLILLCSTFFVLPVTVDFTGGRDTGHVLWLCWPVQGGGEGVFYARRSSLMTYIGQKREARGELASNRYTSFLPLLLSAPFHA